MAYVRINLDTAASEPHKPLMERMMRERPMPRVVGILTPNGNVVAPVAR